MTQIFAERESERKDSEGWWKNPRRFAFPLNLTPSPNLNPPSLCVVAAAFKIRIKIKMKRQRRTLRPALPVKPDDSCIIASAGTRT